MSKFSAYIEDTVTELRYKVSWPTWKDLQNSSIIVLVACVIIALIIWLMDFVFGINSTGFWRGVIGLIYDLING